MGSNIYITYYYGANGTKKAGPLIKTTSFLRAKLKSIILSFIYGKQIRVIGELIISKDKSGRVVYAKKDEEM